jgi:hypothetical protein
MGDSNLNSHGGSCICLHFIELDPDRLPQKIADAQQAIGERTLALARAGGNHRPEQKALGNAHLALDVEKDPSDRPCGGTWTE